MKRMQLLVLSGFLVCVGEGNASFGSECEEQEASLPIYMPPPQIEEHEDEGVFMEENPVDMGLVDIQDQYQHYYKNPNFWVRRSGAPSQEELFGY